MRFNIQHGADGGEDEVMVGGWGIGWEAEAIGGSCPRNAPPECPPSEGTCAAHFKYGLAGRGKQ